MRLECLEPFVAAHLRQVLEATPQQPLGGLVVEHQRAARVDEEDRCGKVARELTHQDQLDRRVIHERYLTNSPTFVYASVGPRLTNAARPRSSVDIAGAF